MTKVFWLAALAVAILTLRATADDKSTPLPSHFPLGKEMCFGRVYDDTHLKSHPKQRVTSFHLFRDFSPDPNTESEPSTPQELLEQDGQDGNVNVTAYVRLRDRKGVFFNGLSCRKYDGTVRCGIDCDGGGFKLRTSNTSLTLQNEGFVVVGGCGASEDEQDRTEFVKPGADDKTFRLDPKPIAECATLRESERPKWAKLGEPLRVRFTRETCFSRTYDDAHLAKNPKQNVRAIKIAKLTPKDDAEPPLYPLSFRLTLRSGETVERTATCSPDSYVYACNLNPDKGEPGFEITLARGAGDNIVLRDAKGAFGKLFPRKLGADDTVFRLQSARDCAP